MTASAATTLVLGAAFAAAAVAVPHGAPVISVPALIIGFMVGSAVGHATPLPAGIGATEAALTGVLVVVGLPIAAAVEAVLLFRVVTFWLPALAGIGAARTLRHRQLL